MTEAIWRGSSDLQDIDPANHKPVMTDRYMCNEIANKLLMLDRWKIAAIHRVASFLFGNQTS